MIPNIVADKVVNAIKNRDIIAVKKLNAAVDNVVNTNKRENVITNK